MMNSNPPNSSRPHPATPAWKEQDDPLWRVHLDFLKENSPDLLLKLWQSNQLKEHLDGKVTQALEAVSKAKAGGASEAEAREQVVASLVAPADGPAFRDNPPNPLPEETLRRLRQWERNLAQS